MRESGQVRLGQLRSHAALSTDFNDVREEVIFSLTTKPDDR